MTQGESPTETQGPATDGAGQTPQRSRLVAQAYRQIHYMILNGEHPRDCKLPTESELSARIGASRPVIRKALARLREQGIVRSQQGSGTFVVRGPRAGAEMFPLIRTVADLLSSYEFRIQVEGQSAYLAAERHTHERRDDIERTLEEAERAIDAASFDRALELNFEFHRTTARATNNPFYVATIEAIPNIIGIAWQTLRLSELEKEVARARTIHDEHMAIFRAIQERDGRRARAEMEAHIDNARQYVLTHRELA